MNNKNPLVTVAIPTFNRANYLREAIISVLNQSYKNIEIIISDNCSTDDTWHVVKEFTDPKLRYYKQQVNLGMVGNWNYCLTQARGDYFLLLSDDDVFEVNAIEHLLSAFSKPGIAISYCRSLYVDDGNMPLGQSVIAPPIESGHEFIINSLKNKRWVVPSSMLHRTEAAIKNGGYPDIGTATDLAMRLMLAMDGSVSFNAMPLVRYRRHELSISTNLSGVISSHGRLIVWAQNSMLHGYYDNIVYYCTLMVYRISRYAIFFGQTESVLVAQDLLQKYSYSKRKKILLKLYKLVLIRYVGKLLWILKSKYFQIRQERYFGERMDKRVLFYSSVTDKKLFEMTGFYKTDISILTELGYDVITSNSFSDFLRFWRYDGVFIYFWTKGIVPAFISKIFNKKVIFTGGIDNLDKEYNKSANDYRIKKLLFRLCTLFSDANIVVSETDMNNIIKTNYKINNLHLIPHVINFDKYKYDNRLKENIITTIVWMGTKGNVCRKGVDKLLHVYKEFLKYDDTFKVIIIGTLGPGTEYLQQIATELNIAERVIFTGGISEEEKIDYLKRSKIYFQLSEYEGFGIAAIEALAAGNVVFHSGKGGLSFTLKSFAFKVEDTADYENIASLLSHVAMSYNKYTDLVSQGMKHIKDNFSYNVRKEKIGSLMSGLFDSESRMGQ